MKKIFFLLFIIFLFNSCQKEIELDLDTTTPKFVIEGIVSTSSNESFVRITKSSNFYDTERFLEIENAEVIIKDETANQEYLFEYGLYNGYAVYRNSLFTGIEGHKYTMQVKVEGQEFTATSTVAPTVELEYLRQVGEAKIEGFGKYKSTFAKIIPVFKDPEELGNNYRFVVGVSKRVYNNVTKQYEYSNQPYLLGIIYAFNDLIFNNTENTRSLNIEVEKDDMVIIDMQNIDNNVYDYLYTLSQSYPQDGGPPTSNPTNPVSNISGGALGYFSAHSSMKKLIIVK